MTTINGPIPVLAHEEQMARFADKAKDLGALTVAFRTAAYPDKETARRAARSFQMAFSTMRTRQRRRIFRLMKRDFPDLDELTFQGPHDNVACSIREVPDGWEIHLTRSDQVFNNAEITGPNGEPVEL